jgi:hypothetical protein
MDTTEKAPLVFTQPYNPSLVQPAFLQVKSKVLDFIESYHKVGGQVVVEVPYLTDYLQVSKVCDQLKEFLLESGMLETLVVIVPRSEKQKIGLLDFSRKGYSPIMYSIHFNFDHYVHSE